MFSRQGEVQVTFEALPFLLKVTQEQLPDLISFHAYLFGDILRLEKAPDFMLLDPEKSTFSPLIVALKKGRTIKANYVT